MGSKWIWSKRIFISAYAAFTLAAMATTTFAQLPTATILGTVRDNSGAVIPGADVAVNYLTYPDAAQELAGQIRALGRRVLLFPVDVSDQAAVEGMVDQLARDLGRLDIFVSSAVYSDRASRPYGRSG